MMQAAEQSDDVPKARAEVEESERLRWCGLFGDFLKSASAPVVARAGSAVAQITGKRRGRTIRQRLKVALKFSRHLQLCSGSWWTTSGTDIVDYMNGRAEEPCGRTVPWDILKACLVVDELGEFYPKASKDPLVMACADSLTLTLSQSSIPRKQAQDYATMMVIGLELAVLDTEREIFWRFYAGVKLVQVVTALRWDDTRGIAWGSWLHLKLSLIHI